MLSKPIAVFLFKSDMGSPIGVGRNVANAKAVLTGIVLAESHMAHIKAVSPSPMARVSTRLLEILQEATFKGPSGAVKGPSEWRSKRDRVSIHNESHYADGMDKRKRKVEKV
jgi:hypothetical protein